jgi:hypothetical protein
MDMPAATGRRTQLNRSTYLAQRLDPPTATRRRTCRNRPTYPAPQIAPHRSPIETPHRRTIDPGTRSTRHRTTRSRRLVWGDGETATGASGRTGARQREPSGTTPGAGTARRRVQRAAPRKGAAAAAPRRSRRTTQATFGVRFQASSRRPAYGHGAPPACVQAREKGSGKRHCGFSVKRCCATSARRVVSRLRRCVVTQRSGCLGGRVPPHEEEPAERES